MLLQLRTAEKRQKMLQKRNKDKNTSQSNKDTINKLESVLQCYRLTGNILKLVFED